jgi:hypothetical protein
LFGSLLKVTTVLAFIPQTVLLHSDRDEKYRDLTEHINDTTKYYLYGALNFTKNNDPHNISHCERISNRENVFLIKKEEVNLKKMRDEGELFSILNNFIVEDA